MICVNILYPPQSNALDSDITLKEKAKDLRDFHYVNK